MEGYRNNCNTTWHTSLAQEVEKSRKAQEETFLSQAHAYRDALTADLTRRGALLDERAEKQAAERTLFLGQQSGSSSNDKELAKIRKELEELKSECQKLLNQVSATSQENAQLKRQIGQYRHLLIFRGHSHGRKQSRKKSSGKKPGQQANSKEARKQLRLSTSMYHKLQLLLCSRSK